MPNEQEIERLLQGLYQSQRWRAAGLCGCCGEPTVDGEHCEKAAAHRRAWAHTERFFRQRADAFGPPCGLYVGKDGQWGTWGYQWGDQPYASWDNIIEECAPDVEGAFKCHEGMELVWTGAELRGVKAAPREQWEREVEALKAEVEDLKATVEDLKDASVAVSMRVDHISNNLEDAGEEWPQG